MKKWNEMSNNCYTFSKTFFTEEYAISTNLKNIENKSFVNKKFHYEIKCLYLANRE